MLLSIEQWEGEEKREKRERARYEKRVRQGGGDSWLEVMVSMIRCVGDADA